MCLFLITFSVAYKFIYRDFGKIAWFRLFFIWWWWIMQ